MTLVRRQTPKTVVSGHFYIRNISAAELDFLYECIFHTSPLFEISVRGQLSINGDVYETDEYMSLQLVIPPKGGKGRNAPTTYLVTDYDGYSPTGIQREVKPVGGIFDEIHINFTPDIEEFEE